MEAGGDANNLVDGGSVEPLYREVGQQIRQVRKVVGLRQRDAADRIGITRSSLANIESGRQRVSLLLIARVAEVLGVEPYDLLPESWIGRERRMATAAQVTKLRAAVSKIAEIVRETTDGSRT